MTSLLGKSVAFPFRLDGAGRIAWSEGETNIRESIEVLLRTDNHERIALPTFGAGLQRWLFSPNTADTHARIAQAVDQTLRKWEPRIALEGVDVTPSDTDATAAVATITFRLVASGERGRVAVGIPLAAGPG